MREPRPVKQDFDKRGDKDAEFIKRFPTAEQQDKVRAAIRETAQRTEKARQALEIKLRTIQKPEPAPTPAGISKGRENDARVQAAKAEHDAEVEKINEDHEKKLEQIERGDDPHEPPPPPGRGGEREEPEPIITDARADKQIENPAAEAPSLTPDEEHQALADAIRAAREARGEAERDSPGQDRER